VFLPGHRLKGRDVMHAGIATHFITKDKVSIIIIARGDFVVESDSVLYLGGCEPSC